MPDQRTSIKIELEGVQLLAATLGSNETFQAGMTLPPCWHWIYLRPHANTSELREDGHPKEIAPHPEASGWPRMWGAGRLRWHDEIKVGETLLYDRSITDVKMKVGRSGRLLVCEVSHRWSRGGGLVLEETQTIVYREPGDAKQVAQEPRNDRGPDGAGEASHSWDHSFTEIELFRYSALTFNSHRIHYDAGYARDIEGFPALVVHGPLLATIAAGFAQTAHGSQGRLSIFDYRITAPAFCGQPVTFSFHKDSETAVVVANRRPSLSARCGFTPRVETAS